MHPATEAILRHFRYAHLPAHLQRVSRPFCELAHALAAVADVGHGYHLEELAATELDGPELTVALRKLLEAKDCAVRAALDT
jgi:hypothetical protein